MQLPLLHRSTQMAVLKKLVRRKVRELRWRRHRAQRRLEMMRQIRWELLRLMQRLLDMRQRDAELHRREQARRAVGGMLLMYRRWLGKWTRALKSQGRLIRQQEQQKRGLSRRLRLLRRRLRKHHRPKQLVDRCFEKLAKAVRRWRRRPDRHQYIEDQELVWAQEAEEVRRYLSDIRGKSVRRRKSPRRTEDDLHIDLPNFNSFWKSEMVRRKKKLGIIQASSQETPSEREVYSIPKPPLSSKIYPSLDAVQMRSGRRRPTRRLSKKDCLVPSFKELQLVFRLLMDQNPLEQGNDTASTRNSKRKLSRKKAKTDLYQDLKREINIRKPQYQRKRDRGNQVSAFLTRLLRIGSAIRSKIQQSRMGSIKRARKHRWPAMTTLRRRIPIRHKTVKKPKSKFVDERIRRELEAKKINHQKGQRRMDSMERNKSPSHKKGTRQKKSKFVEEQNRKELGINNRKSNRRRESMERNKSPSHKKGTRPKKSKFVEEQNRKELGINNRKSNRRRESMEIKSLRDSSDLNSSISKNRSLDEEIRKSIEALEIKNKKGRRRKESTESKNKWDSSDLSISRSHKTSMTENVNKMKSSVESENLWDSSDLEGLRTRLRRSKKIHKKRSKVYLSNQSSDDGTDIMVNKLMKRKQLYETSVSEQDFVRDSIASFSDSLKQIIRESRKSIRKSILGWGPLPAASNSKRRPSIQSNFSQTRASIRDSLPGSYRPRRSARNRVSGMASSPAVSARRSVTADPYGKGTKRRSRGTDGLVVPTSEPIVVQSNDPIAAQSKELVAIRSNVGSVKLGINADNQLGDQQVNKTGNTSGFPIGLVVPTSDPIVVRSNVGSVKLGINADNQLGDQQVNKTGNTSGSPIGLVVPTSGPIVVQSNDPIAAQSKELVAIRSNVGSVKLGITADNQLGGQQVNKTGNTSGSPIGYDKDHEFGKQDTNSAVPEVGYPLRIIRGDQTYDEKETEFKAAETINQDKNKTVPKISFSIGVKIDGQTLCQSNGQDINKTSQDQDQQASRAVGQDNSDNPAHFGKCIHSQSESTTEMILNHKKDEGRQEHTTSPLFSRQYNIQNLQSDAKYRQVQFFLKDVIETNDLLGHVPDVQRLMKAVGNHYMWGNLKDLYSKLLAGGINKADVKRLLTDKYLNYLSSIHNAQMLAPKHAQAREQDDKKQSNWEQLRNLRFWYRHRMSRPFLFSTQSKPNDKGEVRSTETKQDVEGTLYKKLLLQELKAERAKRDKWDERLRRLLPTSETSASMSFASTNTMWEVEAEEEEDLRTIDERYSITNLRKMMKEHEVRFQAMEVDRMNEKVDSKVKMVKEHPESPTPKKLSRRSSNKRERPINQLYYAPRKTSREQQIIKYYSEYSEDEQREALEEESEYGDSCIEKCPICSDKVELPCCAPSPKASSPILSSGSIEACAKNQLLVNTMADVCTRCGYVHDQANPCSQPPEDQRKTLLLRMIKAVQAVRSTAQPTRCSEFCSCREISKRQEKGLRSCKYKLRQVESGVRRCPGADEGGGDR